MTNEFKITVNYPAIEIKLLIDEDPQCNWTTSWLLIQ